MSSPKIFNEPVLTTLRREKEKIEKGDGSLPIKKSWKKVLEEDEKQLDLLEKRRGVIFKTQRQSVPIHSTFSIKKQANGQGKVVMNYKKPSMKEHNTSMVQSPYHRSNTAGS